MTTANITDPRRASDTVHELVRKLGLDRRKRYVEWQGTLCTVERATIDCPGCTDHGDYGERHGPYGCSECGHTGKRRITFPDPIMLNGEWVKVPNAEAQRSPASGDKLPPLVGRDGGKA